MSKLSNEIYITRLSGSDILLGHSYKNLNRILNEPSKNDYLILNLLNKESDRKYTYVDNKNNKYSIIVDRDNNIKIVYKYGTTFSYSLSRFFNSKEDISNLYDYELKKFKNKMVEDSLVKDVRVVEKKIKEYINNKTRTEKDKIIKDLKSFSKIWFTLKNYYEISYFIYGSVKKHKIDPRKIKDRIFSGYISEIEIIADKMKELRIDELRQNKNDT